MMRVVIMAHPARTSRIEAYLRPRLDRQVAAARALGLQVEGPEVVMDDETAGSSPTRLRCFGGEADHTLVAQDDVEMCADFIETACHLVQMRPESVIALAPSRHARLTSAVDFGRAWVPAPMDRWVEHAASPCAVFPAWARARILDHGGGRNDDDLIEHALAGERFYMPVPTIAVHAEVEGTNGSPPRLGRCPPFVGVHERAPLAHYLRQRFTA